jgi:hypothetical protein
MAMPIEVELLVTAWDNAKKNAFDGEGLNIDPETGEIIDGTLMPDDLADLVADIEDKMMDLVSYYRDDEDFVPDDVEVEVGI